MIAGFHLHFHNIIQRIIGIAQNAIYRIDFAELFKQRYQFKQLRIVRVIKPWLYRNLQWKWMVFHLKDFKYIHNFLYAKSGNKALNINFLWALWDNFLNFFKLLPTYRIIWMKYITRWWIINNDNFL